MGVLKIKGRWAIEWYDATGRRRRKVIERPGEKVSGGWYEAAKRAYRDTKARLDRSDTPLFTASKKTLAEVAEKYNQLCAPTWSPSEAARVQNMLDRHILPFFGATRTVETEPFRGGRKIAAVRRVHIEEYIAQRKSDGAAPATANKELARLRHMFNKAIAWGEIQQNPCTGIRSLKEPPPRVAYLDPGERALILTEAAAVSPVLVGIVSVAMLSGARLSEILSLTWGNVDLDRRIVTFRKTKSGRVRHVPMNRDLCGILSRLESNRTDTGPSAPLFPPEWNSKRVSVAFRRITNGQGREGRVAIKPGFRFHDLRHDFASWLTMNGVAIRGVQTLLGHSDLRMTERYSHLADRVLAAAVASLPSLEVPGEGSGNVEPVPGRASPDLPPVPVQRNDHDARCEGKRLSIAAKAEGDDLPTFGVHLTAGA